MLFYAKVKVVVDDQPKRQLTDKAHRKVVLYTAESGGLHGPEVLDLFLLLLGWHRCALWGALSSCKPPQCGFRYFSYVVGIPTSTHWLPAGPRVSAIRL